MIRSIATRIIQVIATLWLASTAVFVMIHLSGDPTQGFVPPGVSPEVREQMRVDLGLDDGSNTHSSLLADLSVISAIVGAINNRR